MTKLVALGHIIAQMELFMKDHGLMINSMVKAKKVGLMVRNMKANM